MSQHREKVENINNTCQLFLQVETINTQKCIVAENVLAVFIKLKPFQSEKDFLRSYAIIHGDTQEQILGSVWGGLCLHFYGPKNSFFNYF